MMSFDVTRFESARAARGLRLGSPVEWRDHTQSTNDDALAGAQSGAPHGALFGAESQSSGRGRRGSTWVSPPSAGLWFSILVRTELSAELAPGLALCAGLAVREAVATRVRVPVLVKWPNDVFANDRKLAGILVESQVSGRKLARAVVGIGINVNQHDFPESLSIIATSLALLGASDTQRESLLVDVLAGLEEHILQLAAQGMSAITPALSTYDALRGRRLRVETHEGTGAGIDASGRLLVRLASGQVEAVAAGHIELLDDARVAVP